MPGVLGAAASLPRIRLEARASSGTRGCSRAEKPQRALAASEFLSNKSRTPLAGEPEDLEI